ncbi:MAG TPA: hypothetical protein VHL80_13195 [Polyangia bacterium]|nr:hypothetical protein [Polyangia bacterium]
MSAPRLKELQIEIAGVRRRLEEWARRLAALRAMAGSGDAGARDLEATPPPERTAAAPLFNRNGPGGGALDDVELTFEVLDTEDPGRGGR